VGVAVPEGAVPSGAIPSRSLQLDDLSAQVCQELAAVGCFFIGQVEYPEPG